MATTEPVGEAGRPAFPMPFPVLLDEAMRWTRRWLRPIYLPIALPVALITAGNAGLQVAWLGGDAGATADPMQKIAHSCSFLLLTLPTIIVLTLLQTAMLVAAVDAVAGRGVDIRRSLLFMVRPRAMLTQFLVLICTVAAAMVCLLPVLYVGPLLSLALPAMAAEGVTGTAALRRSAKLTRYNPRGRLQTSPILKILALLVVITVIAVLVAFLPQLPIVILRGGSTLRKLAAGQDLQRSIGWVQVPMSGVSALITTLVRLYASFALTLLFFDLRARREGGDLQQVIDGMAGAGLDSLLAPPPPLASPIRAPGAPGAPEGPPG